LLRRYNLYWKCQT